MKSGVNSYSPLIVGFVVFGLLMFAVIGIVRNVTADPGASIQTSVAAGVASLQQAPVQGNVSNALPAFTLQQPTQASWLAYKQSSVERLVWAGVWFSCLDLTTASEYVGHDVNTGSAWQQLAQNDRAAVVAVCMAEQPESEQVQ